MWEALSRVCNGYPLSLSLSDRLFTPSGVRLPALCVIPDPTPPLSLSFSLSLSRLSPPCFFELFLFFVVVCLSFVTVIPTHPLPFTPSPPSTPPPLLAICDREQPSGFSKMKNTRSWDLPPPPTSFHPPIPLSDTTIVVDECSPYPPAAKLHSLQEQPPPPPSSSFLPFSCENKTNAEKIVTTQMIPAGSFSKMFLFVCCDFMQLLPLPPFLTFPFSLIHT